jgi:hypothetical protein
LNDRNSRPIILALLAVLVFTALVLIASVVIPFDVERPAIVQSVSGEVELRAPDEMAVRLNPASKTTLEVGHNLDVLPNSEAHVTFELNQGRAILTGPPRWLCSSPTAVRRRSATHPINLSVNMC